MVEQEKGKEELRLLRDYLRDVRQLSARDAVVILINTLFWFNASIKLIEEIYTELELHKLGRQPIGN